MADGKQIDTPGGIRSRIACFIATMGPVGLVPKGPGTLAAFLILIPTFHLATRQLNYMIAILTLVIIVLGQWASQHAERIWGSDPSRVVIDEVAGQMIAILFVPPELLLFIGAFVLFRIFDIVKPWPVSWIDRRNLPWSVMGDDVAAGILSRLILLLLQIRFSS
jgi:phosphatidylglycerophosphatase A